MSDDPGSSRTVSSSTDKDWRPGVVGHKPKDPRSSRLHKFNPFSRMFFCWVDPLFWYGARHTLQQEDLYANPNELDTKYLLEKFLRHWRVEVDRHNRGGRAFLSLAIFKCIWWRIIVHGFIFGMEIPLLLAVAYFLGNITEYLDIESPSSTDKRVAYLSAFGLSGVTMVLVLATAVGAFMGYKLGMVIRIMCTSAIYNKILSLSQSTVSNLTIGHIVNLASNDVHRFDLSMVFYHFLWIGPVFILSVGVVLYYEIGYVAFIAVALVIGQIPIQAVLSKTLSSLRLKAAKVTDERVKVMNEVITGIRVIKMYGWEDAFHRLVATIRQREMRIILKSSIIRAINLSTFATALPTMMFAVFSVYSALGECITLRSVFVTLTLLAMARTLSNFVFISAITNIAEAVVALKRIQKFLLIENLSQTISTENKREMEKQYQEDSKSEKQVLSNGISHSTTDDSYPFVTINGLCASWSENKTNLSLKDISFTVDKEYPLLTVIGSVGAGKSTLLQCLLGELPAVSGDINVNGTVAYAGQEPWIFSATLRENVLFGQPFHPEWYSTVMDVCALEKDLDILPDGDLTLVGERGVTLSGGQKARVSLARAVYRRAGIYLLDDPLSAVDAAVSRHIFDRCIRGLLTESSIVILVTHQLQYVQQCDTVLVLKEGSVKMCGDPTYVLQGSDNNVLNLLKDSNKTDNKFMVRKYSRGAEMEHDIATFKPSMNALEEEVEETIGKEVSIFGVMAVDAKSMTGSSFKQNNDNQSRPVERETNQSLQELSKEGRIEGNISFRTYHNYFKAGGGSFYTFGMFFIFILAEVSVVVSDGWLADWADDSANCLANDTNSTPLSNNVRIGVYGGLLGAVWILCVSRTVLFYIILLRAATYLHNKMFISVLRSPILFFDTNPIGRILNRFSKDTGFLDDILIYIFCEFLQFFTRFLAIVITAGIAIYYLLIVIIIMVIVFTVFRWYFLKTAREIKRLESIARSPLYSHISMTLQGLPTIRAYNKQNDLLHMFYNYQNTHSQGWYLYLVTARWFGVRIDAICALFIALVAFVSIPLAASLDAGFVGLALSYSVSLTGLFQYCVRESAEVESLMVSAERVLNYGRLVSEGNKSEPVPSDWPSKGQIDITDLCYKHNSDGPHVLHGINCKISSGEKVGIVGRTGAGKSSLIASFFRLAEPSGSIRIDGVECFNIGLHDLRTNISIIPQDPVLFSGTIRYNLDPFNQYDDEQIWTAMKQVQLSSVVDSLDGRLEALVTEGGNNFSVGQRQLFCLARALLKHNKVLMLDEATANVDLETDAIIQHVIRKQFIDCTVLTIAHRLDTVMDSDKIMVLRSGNLIEYGGPHELLCDNDSYLLKLVEQTGPVAAEKLKNMALSVYNKK